MTALEESPGVDFTWRLTGVTADWFTSAAVGADKTEYSPVFVAFGKEWRLRLSPNGWGDSHIGHLSLLFLLLVSPDVKLFEPSVLKMTIGSLRKACSEMAFSTLKPQPKGTHKTWGWGDFLSHAVLLASPASYFPGGVMTVTVQLKYYEMNGAAETSVVIPTSNISSDLARLLESDEGADATLLCGAEHFKAHSLVLCARSPVFKAQLKGELASRLDAVPVPDEIDAHTLRRTLSFIYTDECEPTSAEEAQHLLNAADHYGLVRLRAICESHLINVLSIENVGYSLTLAEQHSAPTLKDAALRFLAKHAVAVVKTEGWAHLLSAMPALAGEAMHTLATGVPPEPHQAGDKRRVRQRMA